MGYDLQSLNVTSPSDDELAAIINDAHAQASDNPLQLMQAGFDALEATGCYFRFNYVAWPHLVVLAKKHGWDPSSEPEHEVSDSDAESLADSLERVLLTIKNIQPIVSSHAISATGPFGIELPDGVTSAGPRTDLSAETFWADNPDKIKRFIKFARQGRFSIA